MAAWPQLSPGAVSLDHADQMASAVRREFAPDQGAFPMREACRAAGVKVGSRPLPAGGRRHTAMLVPTDDGFHAAVDPMIWNGARNGDAGRHRLRFVIAHELGHTLFYRPGKPPSRERPADRHEEKFCQNFANSLLVPRSSALATPLEPEGLYSLARRYDVSLRVAAWAIARARPSIAVLWLRHRPHPTRGGLETMRVEWGAAAGRYIAVGESLKSPVADLRPGQDAELMAPLLLAGRREPANIKAWRFDSAMLAVVRPAEGGGQMSSPEHQIALF
jgi:hypothetical protein